MVKMKIRLKSYKPKDCDMIRSNHAIIQRFFTTFVNGSECNMYYVNMACPCILLDLVWCTNLGINLFLSLQIS
jgi:hypothetical protein